MFSILAIGDPHFSQSRLSDLDNIITRLVLCADKLLPNLVVIMGDLLDSHEKANVYVVEKAFDLIRKLHKNHKVVLLIGNHDRPNNSDFLSNLHFFQGLEEWPNVILVDKVKSLTLNDQTLLFVPYVPPGKFNEAIKEQDLSKVRVIFAHQEFYGVQLGPVKSKKGDLWPQENPLVISGHIHHYHWLQKNILYTGAPYQINYGDNVDKAIMVLEFSEERNIPKVRRIKLGIEEKKTVEVDVSQIDSSREKLMEKGVRVIVKGEWEEIEKNKKKLLSLNPMIQFRPEVREEVKSCGTFQEILFGLVRGDRFAEEAYREVIENL